MPVNPPRRWWHRLLCHIGWHAIQSGAVQRNGDRAGICATCDQPFEGRYDMLYGETIWRKVSHDSPHADPVG